MGFAYRSLQARLETLADYPGTEAFLDEAGEIHYSIRRALGHGLQRQTIVMPCPGCKTRFMFRTVYDDRRDVIECFQCGYEIKDRNYGLYAEILIDELLKQADETAALTNTASQCEHSASGETLP